jgi:hypothetical protein
MDLITELSPSFNSMRVLHTKDQVRAWLIRYNIPRITPPPPPPHPVIIEGAVTTNKDHQ